MGLIIRKIIVSFLYVNSFVIILLGASISGLGVFLSFPIGIGEGHRNVRAMVREYEN